MENFGTVFKVHGIVVIPFSAPDESVLFEDFHDFFGDEILVTISFIPLPVVGLFDIKINGNAEGMGAEAFRSGDGTPIVSPAAGSGELVEVFWKLFNFGRDRLEFLSDPIDGGGPDFLRGDIGEPGDGGEVFLNLGGSFAIHFFEKGFVADAPGVGMRRGRGEGVGA